MVLGLAGHGWAAPSDTITVTVSLAETVSVSLDNHTWTIGAITLGSTAGPALYTATNNGNVAINLTIRATNGAGGWTLAPSPGPNAFSVTVASPSITLRTSDQALAANVAVGGTKPISLTYWTPTSDTIGGGVSQGFSIIVSATKYVP